MNCLLKESFELAFLLKKSLALFSFDILLAMLTAEISIPLAFGALCPDFEPVVRFEP